MISSEASLGASAPPYFSQPQSEPEYMNTVAFAPSSYSYQPSVMCSMQTQAHCFGNFPFGLPQQMPPYQQPPVPPPTMPVPFDDRRLVAQTSISQNVPMPSSMMQSFALPASTPSLPPPPPFAFSSSGVGGSGGNAGVNVPSSSNSSGQPFGASAVDSCQQISHVLQCYQQGGEDAEFVRKAIESLVKKLKEKRVELDALITAITSAGKQPTTCVTIQRSLDGRLQVAGRKGVPHVVYARIWRWPNVSKNELVKLSMCTIPAEHQDFICINPYHYERVVSNGLAPPDLKSLRVDPAPLSIINKSEYPVQDYEMSEAVPNNSRGHSTVQGSPAAIQNYDLSQVQLPTISLPEDWCSVIYYELDTQIGETFKIKNDELRVDGGMDPLALHKGRLCLGALPNVHRCEVSERTRIHIGDGVELRACPSGDVMMSCRSHKPIFVRSGFLDYCNKVPYGNKPHRFTQESEVTKVGGSGTNPLIIHAKQPVQVLVANISVTARLLVTCSERS
ncbi:Dwarfin sma [Trichostrongylus colubriformis]|uniref:Mothers against decapentaplegic homolog n=1 Tax=Trichostrongylus colubriformis TaxID=6319 RepID=A0AAN8G3S5_TRICO